MKNRFYEKFDWERREESPGVASGDYRSPFQVDRDRIIHTSAFRCLQNKTQVFFSGEYDFYRTRLTHSIEVAQIGRSICYRLNQTSSLLEGEAQIDSDLVEAACLAVTKIESDHVEGILMNDPHELLDVHRGAEVRFSLDRLNDWIYSEQDGRHVGGFTLDVLAEGDED